MTKTLGILGGMSWVSTQQYYSLINQHVAKARRRQHSADIIIASVDFQNIIDAQVAGNWSLAGALLANKAQNLAAAGCGAFLIASNTMHKVFDQVQSAVPIPGLNIFDTTAEAIQVQGQQRVALIGTRYTMNDRFFVDEYHQRGVDIIIPNQSDRHRINEIIFKELIHNIVKPESIKFYKSVILRLCEQGAEGVILGCTEIELLVKPGDLEVTLYDTTALHAHMASQWILGIR